MKINDIEKTFVVKINNIDIPTINIFSFVDFATDGKFVNEYIIKTGNNIANNQRNKGVRVWKK